METGIQVGRARRILTKTAFEVADRIHERNDERLKIGLAEYTEEWHVELSGTISNNADFPQAEAPIEFSMDFFLAPEQRRSDLLMPTFHFGSYQLVDDNPDMVVVTAAVREWDVRNDGAYIGATVRFGVFSPSVTDDTAFALVAHLSFSGWGAPHDAEVSEPDTP